MKKKCPICGKEFVHRAESVGGGSGFFPFCGKRCQLVDLGAWFDGQYIVSQPLQNNQFEDE
ncbi:MAG: DNA gyrase inhibitor YacG [Anaerohalosphaeraceae bacterium]|nr:DNA gyrase inhibitor YacG [Anaerohalosphaeraceae bacterium]